MARSSGGLQQVIWLRGVLPCEIMRGVEWACRKCIDADKKSAHRDRAARRLRLLAL
jgi:hypothetical protein